MAYLVMGPAHELAPAALASSKRVLDPMDRITEVLCGLIMVLTFTLAASISGREDVHSMLFAALGCNFAWGIIDGVVYLMAQLSERARAVRALRAVRGPSSFQDARQLIAEALPPVLASALTPEDYSQLQQRLRQVPEPPDAVLTSKAWRGAIGVFLLVFVSTLPVAAPFAVLTNFQLARRISNLIALAMLFATGYAYGRYAGYNPVRMGLSMVLLGSVLIAVAVLFGG